MACVEVKCRPDVTIRANIDKILDTLNDHKIAPSNWCSIMNKSASYLSGLSRPYGNINIELFNSFITMFGLNRGDYLPPEEPANNRETTSEEQNRIAEGVKLYSVIHKIAQTVETKLASLDGWADHLCNEVETLPKAMQTVLDPIPDALKAVGAGIAEFRLAVVKDLGIIKNHNSDILSKMNDIGKTVCELNTKDPKFELSLSAQFSKRLDQIDRLLTEIEKNTRKTREAGDANHGGTSNRLNTLIEIEKKQLEVLNRLDAAWASRPVEDVKDA